MSDHDHTCAPIRHPLRRRLLLGGSASAALTGLFGAWREVAAQVPAASASGSGAAKPLAGRAPSLFVGHGSPMNAIETNDYTRALTALGLAIGRPRAILVVSAHWLTQREVQVSLAEQPETMHDFGGFPPRLHAVQYRAPGAPAVARRAAAGLVPQRVGLSPDRGLDHGAWSVLTHLYPAADVPVFQISIDITRPGAYHLGVGRALAALRGEGVLILGSGNVVHNLRDTQPGAPASPRGLTRWADEFDQRCKQAVDAGDTRALAAYAQLSAEAERAVPFPDHYYPLLYAMGAAQTGETPRHVFEGFQAGTLSMRCVMWG
ncbi:MAG: dioxygenase extradiol [Pseudomonadota bacterium]|jgi:4,5-DOPA dioxygenase extradiol